MHICIKKICYQHPALKQVIQNSIGNPTDEKINSVLLFYKNKGKLIGAFVNGNLVGCFGYESNSKQLIIKHLSVIKEFQNNKIGTKLLKHIMNDETFHFIQAYTDDDAIFFYRKMKFSCKQIKTHFHLKRFECTYV